jgi:hypothetical protein
MSEPRSRPSFAIPQRPERRFSRSSGLSYEGTTVFMLTPDRVPEGGATETGADAAGASGSDPGVDARLYDLVERVLGADPYTYGDWFDLPMPVFLVHDRETSDVFRVAIRDGKVELHVLPETDSEGLSALYERLCAATEDEPGAETDTGTTGRSAGGTWHVECRIDADR